MTKKSAKKTAKQAESPSHQTTRAKFVERSSILLDDTFRCRLREDSKTVKDYADTFKDYKEAVEKNEKPDYPFPPVWIWQDKDGLFYLIAGFHRVNAAKKAGVDQILAKQFIGSKEEALIFAIKDNRTNGLRMSLGDLKYAITKVLELYPNRTAGWVAKTSGYTRSYVYRIQEELTKSGQLDKAKEQVGADGRVQDHASKQTEKPTEKPKPTHVLVLAEEDAAQLKKMSIAARSARVVDFLDKVVGDDDTEEERSHFYSRIHEWAERKRKRSLPPKE